MWKSRKGRKKRVWRDLDRACPPVSAHPSQRSENLRAEINRIAIPATLIIPTQADLEAICRTHVARPTRLPVGSDQMVAANKL